MNGVYLLLWLACWPLSLWLLHISWKNEAKASQWIDKKYGEGEILVACFISLLGPLTLCSSFVTWLISLDSIQHAENRFKP